ncbi:MAG TPA: NAD(P)H-dependent oxidoreductase [Stellaceae bacterium]|jgi:NAD(P)H dehydrogenase (quinone)|nr:NAD(P)H-dependent oxidoreductase [Stellaceae bacterium]
MKHLIVVAHPNRSSLTHALAEAYANELAAMGHDPDIRDLYALDFNPVLESSELGGAGLIDAHIEQSHLTKADATAFFYPLWWASMPAILKGYIDRVFSHGVAYDFQRGAMHGLLMGKTNLLVTLSAAPRDALAKTGAWDAIRAIQDAHIFHSVGLTLADHIHFGEVVPGMSEVIAHRHIATIREAAHRHFPPVLRATA